MKLLQVLMTAGMAASIAVLSMRAAETPKFVKNPAGFEIHRGVNLSHWLSQALGESYRNDYITEKDFTYIRSAGFDHVRLPIDEQEMWTEDGKMRPESFAYVTRALDWAHQHGLRTIVDLHIVRAHYFNAANDGMKNVLFSDPRAQDHFMQLWRDISSVVKKYPVKEVAYEIMNEPVADNPEDWNKIVDRATKTIRALEPDRVIVIGSNRWQTAPNFPFLKVPANDKNLILSVHTYEPLAFTHHLASWVIYKSYTGPVHYPGQTITPEDFDANVPKSSPLYSHRDEATQVWDKARLAQLLQPAIDKARELNLELYCGEFGALPTTPRKDRLAWYTDMVDLFEDNGISWAIWEYKAEFGVMQYDAKTRKQSEPDEGLLRALMHRK